MRPSDFRLIQIRCKWLSPRMVRSFRRMLQAIPAFRSRHLTQTGRSRSGRYRRRPISHSRRFSCATRASRSKAIRSPLPRQGRFWKPCSPISMTTASRQTAIDLQRWVAGGSYHRIRASNGQIADIFSESTGNDSPILCLHTAGADTRQFHTASCATPISAATGA